MLQTLWSFTLSKINANWMYFVPLKKSLMFVPATKTLLWNRNCCLPWRNWGQKHDYRNRPNRKVFWSVTTIAKVKSVKSFEKVLHTSTNKKRNKRIKLINVHIELKSSNLSCATGRLVSTDYLLHNHKMWNITHLCSSLLWAGLGYFRFRPV